MTEEATLPRLLRRNAEVMASRPAMREKRRGIWQVFTWSRYWKRCASSPWDLRRQASPAAKNSP